MHTSCFTMALPPLNCHLQPCAGMQQPVGRVCSVSGNQGHLLAGGHTTVLTPPTLMLLCYRWHHIFLPLLPRSLSDYLTAPMPFLIGMPAQLLPAIKNLPMDEITLIDLDLGK